MPGASSTVQPRRADGGTRSRVTTTHESDRCLEHLFVASDYVLDCPTQGSMIAQGEQIEMLLGDAFGECEARRVGSQLAQL